MISKITKVFTITLIIFIFFTCSNANAQSTSKSNFRFGIGVDGLVPLSSFRSTVNYALGITPRLQYTLNNDVAFTFTTGYYHFFTKPLYIPAGEFGAGERIQNDLDIIPIKIGAKYFVSSNFYLAGEAGLGLEVDNGGGDSKLILSPGIGYANKRWDIAIRYENFRGQNYNYSTAGLRVAYGFGL